MASHWTRFYKIRGCKSRLYFLSKLQKYRHLHWILEENFHFHLGKINPLPETSSHLSNAMEEFDFNTSDQTAVRNVWLTALATLGAGRGCDGQKGTKASKLEMMAARLIDFKFAISLFSNVKRMNWINFFCACLRCRFQEKGLTPKWQFWANQSQSCWKEASSGLFCRCTTGYVRIDPTGLIVYWVHVYSTSSGKVRKTICAALQ